MRTPRTLLGLAIGTLLSISAVAAQAAMSIHIVEAQDEHGLFVQANTLTVRVTPDSDDELYLVSAEYEGVTIELTPADDGAYEGTFDISGVAYGPHPLTVRGFDIWGDISEVAQKDVHRYAPPKVWLSALRPNSVIGTTPVLDARCVPTPPYDCTNLCVHVSVGGNAQSPRCVFRAASATPTTMYFLERVQSFNAFSPGDVLTITVAASTHVHGRGEGSPQTRQTVGPLYVENSSKLTVAQQVSGAILDFDATRILFLEPNGRLGVMDRATQGATWIATIPPDPAGAVTSYGALTPSGAAVQSSTGRIYTWVNGQWTRIVPSGRLDAVNGDKLVWTRENEDRAYEHVISTGLNASIWNRPGSTSPFQADITPSGAVYFGTYDTSWISLLGVRRIGDHPGRLQRPISDGVNVAGRWWNGLTSSSYLFTATGEEVFLGDSISGNSAGLLLHAGYTAFLKSDGSVNQVWLRTPDGEQHQISSFATSSLFDQQKLHVGHDGISDSGEIVFFNGRTRYVGGPGLEPEAVSSDLGHARWIDGSLQLSIGNTLFHVERAPAEGAGETPVAELPAASPELDESDPGAGELGSVGELIAEETARRLALHEPDALPAEPDALPAVPDAPDGADEATFDAQGEDVAAGLGCSAGPAGSSGGATALVMALAGLALGRRGRRRS